MSQPESASAIASPEAAAQVRTRIESERSWISLHLTQLVWRWARYVRQNTLSHDNPHKPFLGRTCDQLPIAIEDTAPDKSSRVTRPRTFSRVQMPIVQIDWLMDPKRVIEACGLGAGRLPTDTVRQHGRAKKVAI